MRRVEFSIGHGILTIRIAKWRPSMFYNCWDFKKPSCRNSWKLSADMNQLIANASPGDY
jgi:hypothetical protein